MAVTVRGLARVLRPENTVMILVRCEPSEHARAAAALDTAAADLLRLNDEPFPDGDSHGPSYVSAATPTPLGPVLLVDLGDTPRPVLRGVSDLLVARLEAGGVQQAVVGSAPRIGRRWSAVTGLGPAVRGWWQGPLQQPFGEAPRAPAEHLLDVGLGWLEAELVTGRELVQTVISTEIPIGWAQARAAASATLRAGGCGLWSSDFATAVTGVSLGTAVTRPGVAITWARAGAEAAQVPPPWTGSAPRCARVSSRGTRWTGRPSTSTWTPTGSSVARAMHSSLPADRTTPS